MKGLLIAGKATVAGFHALQLARTLDQWTIYAARNRRALNTNDREGQLTVGVGEL